MPLCLRPTVLVLAFEQLMYPCNRWEDVGGLDDVRDALREALELPKRTPKAIARCARVRAVCRHQPMRNIGLRL